MIATYRFLLILMGCAPLFGAETATLVLKNGNLWTGNPDQPAAQALAVTGDRITAVGSNQDVEALIGPETEVINARGSFVTPGFIDSHVHLFTGGFGLTSVQLRNATTPAEFTARIEAYAKTLKPGAWITEGNWDHQNWGGELPTREWIDAVTPNNPVAITRLDGHMILANSLALSLGGVDKNTAEVPGGEIVRFPDGRPTGILKDDAMALIFRVVRRDGNDAYDNAMEAAMTYLNSQGVTSVHFMSLDAGKEFPALQRVRQRDRMTLRVYANMRLRNWEYLRDFVVENGRGDHWLKFGGLKAFVDGSLGSHTAAFFEPYLDTPGENGLMVNTQANLHRWTKDADRAGFQVMIHAIGDRAINTLLNVFQQVARENGARDRRFRIEHAQHLAAADIARFAALGVIPSMQPYHAIDDGRWAEKLIGPTRAQTTYAFRSLLDRQARIAFGSDWPVAPASASMGVYAAVTRRTLDHQNPDGWVPQQKITVEEALRGYTVDAAYASFDENLKGSLQTGMLADFVIHEKDFRAVPAQEIGKVGVLKTVVGGKVVWQKQVAVETDNSTLEMEK